jgi:hypothetical protein
MTQYAFIDKDKLTTIEASDSDAIKISASDLKAATGWDVKPEGFCFGDICVPAGDTVSEDGSVDLNGYARLTGRPLIVDEQEKALSLGTAAQDRGASMASLEAPDFTLPDLEGKMHSLSEFRGKKVLLAAYASW